MACCQETMFRPTIGLEQLTNNASAPTIEFTQLTNNTTADMSYSHIDTIDNKLLVAHDWKFSWTCPKNKDQQDKPFLLQNTFTDNTRQAPAATTRARQVTSQAASSNLYWLNHATTPYNSIENPPQLLLPLCNKTHSRTSSHSGRAPQDASKHESRM